MVQPVIEAGDVLASGSNTPNTACTVDYPAYASGDLLIQFWGGDNDLTEAPIAAPTGGGNGETLILTDTGSGGNATTGPGSGVIAWVGDNTESAASLTWTRSLSNEEWVGYTVKVLAGEFNSTTPLSVVSGYSGNTSTGGTTIATPSWTIGAADDGGTVVCGITVDTDGVGGTPSGWTLLVATDLGNIAGGVAVQDAETTASETITSVDYVPTPTADSSSTIAVVVRPPAEVGTTIIVPTGPWR